MTYGLQDILRVTCFLVAFCRLELSRMADVSTRRMQIRQTSTTSLEDVLHTAPRLYELLPPVSRQLLSATCSYLHTWIRQRTICLKVRSPEDLSGLAPKDWPNLSGVLLRGRRLRYTDFAKLLPDKWQLDAQLCFQKDPDNVRYFWDYLHHEVVLRLRTSGKSYL